MKTRFFNFFLFLIGLLFSLSLSAKQKLTLSEEDFLKAVMNSSPQINKLKAKKKKTKSQILMEKHSFFDWDLNSSWINKKAQHPEVTKFKPKSQETQNFQIGLKKNLPYGLGLSYSYLDSEEQSSVAEGVNKPWITPSLYSKDMQFEISSDLLRVVTDHWLISSFNKSVDMNDKKHFEDAEQTLIGALSQYWKTYIAFVRLREEKKGLKTYKKLVSQIRNKQKYNFLQPGERPQILAEYQNIQKSREEAEQAYEEEERALLLFLKKDPSQEYFSFSSEKS